MLSSRDEEEALLLSPGEGMCREGRMVVMCSLVKQSSCVRFQVSVPGLPERTTELSSPCSLSMCRCLRGAGGIWLAVAGDAPEVHASKGTGDLFGRQSWSAGGLVGLPPKLQGEHQAQ